ncbi:MAG: hypothetical protein NVS3B14_20200 [Ktedonobacteraceae bacterium]
MATPFIPRPEPDDNPDDAAQFVETTTQIDGQPGEESTRSSSATETQLPPEAKGKANGGPLGCCFGVSMGLLLSAGIVSLAIPVLGHASTQPLNGWLSFMVNAAMVVFVIVATIALGYAGWKIGRKVFREYEPSARQQQKRARIEQRPRARAPAPPPVIMV